MNPFQLSSAHGGLQVDPIEESRNSIRTIRLLDDLSVLAGEIDADQCDDLVVLRGPDRLEYHLRGTSAVDVAPLLAEALLSALEELLTCGEAVRAALPDEWRDRLLGLVGTMPQRR